jgi:hypothetical protein
VEELTEAVETWTCRSEVGSTVISPVEIRKVQRSKYSTLGILDARSNNGVKSVGKGVVDD